MLRGFGLGLSDHQAYIDEPSAPSIRAQRSITAGIMLFLLGVFGPKVYWFKLLFEQEALP